MSERTYKDFVANDEYIAQYTEYQQRYRTTIRESDRVLIALVREAAAGKSARLLDIGCSSGNFLRHLSRIVPGLDLVGGDLTPTVLDQCRADPELEGIQFDELDILALQANAYDIVVANAVIYLLRDNEYDPAAQSLFDALRPGGTFLAFDFFHPFEQELAILERSRVDPIGTTLHVRPYSRARAAYGGAGFAELEFRPFEIPIDLERPAEDADITTHTVRTEDGEGSFSAERCTNRGATSLRGNRPEARALHSLDPPARA